MDLRFDDPRWLYAAAAIAAILLFIGWRCFRIMALPRRVSAIVTRLILIAIIAALLAGATLRRETDRMSVIAVVDVSGSVRRFAHFTGADQKPIPIEDAARTWVAAASADRKLDDTVGVIVFDGRAVALLSPSTDAAFEPWVQVPTQEGTDLGGALRLAGAMLPPGSRGRIVLFSDGQETASQSRSGASALDVAGELALRRADAANPTRTTNTTGFGGVDVVPIEYDAPREVVVETVDAPPRASGESTVLLRAVINATVPSTGTLRVLDNGQPLPISNDSSTGQGPTTSPSRRVSLPAGRSVELLEVKLNSARLHRFEVVFEPDLPAQANAPTGSTSNAAPAAAIPTPTDTVAENNRARAFTLASGRTSVLIIDGVSSGNPNGSGAALSAALSAGGVEGGGARGTRGAGGAGGVVAAGGTAFSVETISPDAFTGDMLSLQGFDTIILQNVPAESLDLAAQNALATYVREMAGGLIMVGGPDSFGPGGWKGTPIESVLPVKFDLPEQLVTPAAAVVIVLDMSGSMSRSVMGSSLSQMEIASEGAARAIKAMDPLDMVGVVAFSDRTEVILPLERNRDPSRAADRVRSIMPDGGTTIGPALQIAGAQLAGANATEKHIILLTDGRSTDADALPAIAENLHKQGIKLSSISVGDETDTTSLVAIARIGGGKFYRVVDPLLLPRIFVKAVRVIRSPMIRLEDFVPALAGADTSRGRADADSAVVAELLDASRGRGGIPPLHGLVLTRPRLDAAVTIAAVTPRGDPLLAYWNVGLGKAAAWTSDAHDWSADWLNWPGYSRMWSQLVRTVARPAANRDLELRAELDQDRLLIRLESLGMQASDAANASLTVPVTVFAPDGSRVETTLAPIGSGLYEVRADAPLSGTYIVVARPRAGDNSPLPPLIAGVSRTEGLEYRSTRSNTRLLEEIAARTGGRVLSWQSPATARLFDRQGVPPAEMRLSIWRPLLWALLAVMLLDIATRRIAWDRWVSREFGDDVKRGVREAVRDRSATAAATIGQLRQRGESILASEEPFVRADSPSASAQRPAQLDESDAAEIIRRERQRRRDARSVQHGSGGAPPQSQEQDSTNVAASSGRGGVANPQRDTPPAKPAPKTSAPEQTPENPDQRGGLFAAKRRAQERIDDRE